MKMGERKTFLQKLSNFIFGETVIVLHPFFGELVDTGDDYEGKKIFAPINQSLEFWLKKTSPELEAKQIAFFQELNTNYLKLVASISPALEKEIGNWIPGYRIMDFNKEFTLEFLRIPDFREENPEWEISFYADNDLQHWCSLEMKGMEVVGVIIDG